MKKKLLSWGDILVSLRSWRLQDSKMPAMKPLPQKKEDFFFLVCLFVCLWDFFFILWPSPSTCSSANSKELSCMDCQAPPPPSQTLPFFVNRSADQELWISIYKAIAELVSWKKFEFAVLDLGFEILGLGLDNCGRTTKNAYRHIYSLWLAQGGEVAYSVRIPKRRISGGMDFFKAPVARRAQTALSHLFVRFLNPILGCSRTFTCIFAFDSVHVENVWERSSIFKGVLFQMSPITCRTFVQNMHFVAEMAGVIDV